ncbi:MAG: phosphoenolpyruvate kinase [Spirochaetales bacterium]|nr:phosphoenolpyruvate kinase [Spirochaetales bacterium]
MAKTLNPDEIAPLLRELGQANLAAMQVYPGDSPDRQPVHTVYGGAHLFKADTALKLGELSLNALRDNAPDFASLARALQLPGERQLPVSVSGVNDLKARIEENPEFMKRENPAAVLLHTIYERVLNKLKREAVEDFRIDFEDGYGNRPDAEEDEQARIAARETALGMKNGTLPPFIGIRVKPLTEELKDRSIATLDIFVSTLLEATGGKLPENFVITIPKVIIPEQVATVSQLLGIIEKKYNLKEGTLKIELMVETTQSILSYQGLATLPLLVQAAGGRCRGAHFGTYDYTASCNITAAYQAMDHLACDFAKHVMKVTLAATGLMLSDGATNVMPVGPHRRGKEGGELTFEQLAENRDVVHRAWRLAYGHVRHSLINGFYQGWDLHPAQFIVRYAALYTFFLESLPDASHRLKNFIEKAAQATLVGDVFDDAATGQGLLNFFLRALSCGAITENEILATGLTLEEIRGRSFVKILNRRRPA